MSQQKQNKDLELARQLMREWYAKWIAYLVLGNGAALLATTTAALNNPVAAPYFLKSAWCFFAGTVAGGSIPFFRAKRAAGHGRQLAHGKITPLLRMSHTAGEVAQALSAAAFIIGIGLGLSSLPSIEKSVEAAKAAQLTAARTVSPTSAGKHEPALPK